MAVPRRGKTERRLAAVILLTATVPLVTAVLLASSLFQQASSIWFNPEVGQQLDRGVALYKDYVAALKADMRHTTDAIAADELLREAAHKHNAALVEVELDAIFPKFPNLVALEVQDGTGRVLGRRDRGRPVDGTLERSMDVQRPLSDDAEPAQVVARFAVDRRRLDELEASGSLLAKYHKLEGSRSELQAGLLKAFAALLAITMLLTATLGVALARGVTKRISRLTDAINRAAEGDLSVRVPITGSDEMTELARVFNHMLDEMVESRLRIAYLQRLGAWQEMARRLAHEIKNPLTPIQLAVQECHRKYAGDDPQFRGLLNTTAEIVEEEVGTLRRLVGTFSAFARMPEAQLTEEPLRELLTDCKEQLVHLEDPALGLEEADPALGDTNVEICWEIPSEPLVAAIDRQLLRRVLVNLVRNSVQAIRDARGGPRESGSVLGHVIVRAELAGGAPELVVEDDGPGIAEGLRESIFEPYVTTKSDGTGLGLSIAQKIVVEHGGRISVGKSQRLGGARFVVHLPPVRRDGTKSKRSAALDALGES